METKRTWRGFAEQADESRGSRRTRGRPVETICNDIWSTVSVGTIRRNDVWATVSKAYRNADLQEDGSASEDAVDDNFLPSIFNHITMAHIVPKLRWTDILKLASVSPTWFQGIRSHHVHVERTSYGSAKTYVLVHFYRKPRAEISEGMRTVSIALYSMEEDRFYQLPELPYFHAAMPGSYRCVSVTLDGKVYVMESSASFQNWTKPTVTSRMMTFDVTGQGGWQRTTCNFQCGILNARIYAVGGLDEKCPAHYCSPVTAEVYSPIDNTWSLIKPVKDAEIGDTVWSLGDKLAVRRNPKERELHHENLDVYDPTKDEWAEVELSLLVEDGWSFNRDYDFQHFRIFHSEGKFYLMDPWKIYFFDSESGVWKSLHALSFTEIGMGSRNSFDVFPMKVLKVDEELIAVVRVSKETLLFRSRSRLGGGNREIVWQRVNTDVLYHLEGGMGGALRI